MFRRILPMALHRTSDPEGIVTLVNQPPAKYKPTKWFKNEMVRPTMFWPVVELDQEYNIDYYSYNPRKAQYWLRYCPSGHAIVLHIYYREPLRLEVWKDDVRMPGQFVLPTIESAGGANYYSDESRRISFTLPCSPDSAEATKFEVLQLPVVRVTIRLEMTVEQFYDQVEDFMQVMAAVLKVS